MFSQIILVCGQATNFRVRVGSGSYYFGSESGDVVVQQGEVAFFNCHVHNIANQTVSQKSLSDLFPQSVQPPHRMSCFPINPYVRL